MSSNSRVAIVTGAAQGIGRAIAKRLAQDGCDIVLTDLQSQGLNQTAIQIQELDVQGRYLVVQADVSVEEDVQRLVQVTAEHMGRVDIMVANAGIVKIGPIMDAPVEDLEQSFSVNVKGTWLCLKYAARAMAESGRGGRIIAASSTAGRRGRAFCGAYCMSKFAIRGIVQSACEWGKHNITVNCYAPGPVDTSLMDTMANELYQPLHLNGPEAFREASKQQIPLGRIGETDDVASVVSFLCGKDSAFITGQTISVNGGMLFD